MSVLKPRAVNVNPDIELLRGFKRHEIDLIAAAARLRRFPAKSLMTHQDDFPQLTKCHRDPYCLKQIQ